MDSSDDARKRLRDKIRAKKNQRSGSAPPELPSHEKDPKLNKELSQKVEAELKKAFGSDEEMMKLAKPFIDNPLSVIASPEDFLSSLSTEEREKYDDASKVLFDEDESPPSFAA
jgi:hypothetical protein